MEDQEQKEFLSDIIAATENVEKIRARTAQIYEVWSKKMGSFIFWLKMMIAALLLVALTHVTIYLLQRHDLKTAQQQIEKAKQHDKNN